MGTKTGHTIHNPNNEPITADTPLLPTEQRFITEYMRTGNGAQSVKNIGIQCASEKGYTQYAHHLLTKPNIQAEIKRIMEEIRKDTIATADEVMSYFTSVMRGEVKDQFGLEASLSERTRAAQEIAKRTVDIDNRKSALGDNTINVTLSWDD